MKGTIKSFSYVETQDAQITALEQERCRALQIINQCDVSIFLYNQATQVEVPANAVFLLGGYDDSFRVEDIAMRIDPAATVRRVVIIKDLQQKNPSILG